MSKLNFRSGPVRNNVRSHPDATLTGVEIYGLRGEQGLSGLLNECLLSANPFYGVEIRAYEEAEADRIRAFGFRMQEYKRGYNKNEDNTEKEVVYWFVRAKCDSRDQMGNMRAPIRVVNHNKEDLSEEEILSVGDGSITDLVFEAIPAKDTSRGISTIFHLKGVKVIEAVEALDENEMFA